MKTLNYYIFGILFVKINLSVIPLFLVQRELYEMFNATMIPAIPKNNSSYSELN